MYELVTHKLPKGQKINNFAKDMIRKIRRGEDVEESKDLLFRTTYVIGLGELKKYSYIGSTYDLMPDMSIAFMKTVNNFDPEKPGGSFMNYYRRCINTEILWNYYGKHKNKEEWKEGYRDFMYSRSLDEPLVDKNEKESGTLVDTLQDSKFDMNDEENRIAIEDVMRRALKEIRKNKNLKQKGKDIFEYYIECCLNNKEVKQTEIAKVFDTCRSNVNLIINRYTPIFADILRKEGYSIEGK